MTYGDYSWERCKCNAEEGRRGQQSSGPCHPRLQHACLRGLSPSTSSAIHYGKALRMGRRQPAMSYPHIAKGGNCCMAISGISSHCLTNNSTRMADPNVTRSRRMLPFLTSGGSARVTGQSRGVHKPHRTVCLPPTRPPLCGTSCRVRSCQERGERDVTSCRRHRRSGTPATSGRTAARAR